MEKATDFRLIFITTDSFDNTYHLAKILVNEKLAACCSIIPNTFSIFGWQGAIHERNEFTMMVKTSVDKLPLLEKRVKDLHTDEVPEILSMKLEDGHEPYLAWIRLTLSESKQKK